MWPSAARSRSRSRPGRSRLAPLKPSSSTTHSSGTPYPCSRANSMSAAVWLAIVFSSFCCSEETLAKSSAAFLAFAPHVRIGADGAGLFRNQDLVDLLEFDGEETVEGVLELDAAIMA